MSNPFIKNLPWIAPTVAILAVGSGFLDRINFSLDSAEPDVAQVAPVVAAPVVAEPDPALAALAAVTAATTAALVAPPEPENVADQLAALLTEAETGGVVVTRNTGFATDTLAPAAVEGAAASSQPSTQSQSAPVGADFFNAAQANLAQANSCANDLRNLATQAKVYFPSGALNGESTGIAQARLIGTIAARCSGVSIEVQGHSDPSGNPEINLRLSQERAEAVIARISAAGIDTSKFVAIGMGSARPSNVTGVEGDAYYDRHVEFSIADIVQEAAFVSPALNAGGTFLRTACVEQLQEAVEATTISYAPGSVTVSQDDMNAALGLAQLASTCPEARLRIVGQFADEFGTVEDASTARLRAIALMTTMVGAGYASEQIIMAAPSHSQPVQGLSNSRVDFDVILEEL